MDKLTAIKIKYQDGTYSDEIPLSALAENVEWDSTHNLSFVLGNVNLNESSGGGSIQHQIDVLVANKASASSVTALEAAVANKADTSTIELMQEELTSLTQSYTPGETTGDAEVIAARTEYLDGAYTYNNLGDSIRGQVAKLKDNVIKASTTQPTTNYNKIWVNSNTLD